MHIHIVHMHIRSVFVQCFSSNCKCHLFVRRLLVSESMKDQKDKKDSKDKKTKKNADHGFKKARVVDFGQVEPSQYIVKRILSKNGLVANEKASPLQWKSHCAGADGPGHALDAILGANHTCLVASECAPGPAMYIYKNHPRTEHIVASVKFCTKDKAPCLKHGGAMCDVRKKKPSLVVGSFMCNVYSPANAQRSKKDPIQSFGDSNDVDTFRFFRENVRTDQPDYFLGENTDGVLLPRGPGSSTTPLDYMLGDERFGLRTIKDSSGAVAYNVAVRSSSRGVDVSVPIDRPRTLFIGAHKRTGKSGEHLAERFDAILSKITSLIHVDSFIQEYTSDMSGTSIQEDANCKTDAQEDDALDDMAVEIQYLTACKDALQRARDRKIWTEGMDLPPKWDRESFKHDAARACTPRIRATIDVLAVIIAHETRKKGEQLGDRSLVLHPIGDPSQSVDRKAYRCDGMLSAVISKTSFYSFREHKWLSLKDVAAVMGLPRKSNFSFLSTSGMRTLIGNGYIMPLAAAALLPVLEATGHIVSSE